MEDIKVLSIIGLSKEVIDFISSALKNKKLIPYTHIYVYTNCENNEVLKNQITEMVLPKWCFVTSLSSTDQILNLKWVGTHLVVIPPKNVKEGTYEYYDTFLKYKDRYGYLRNHIKLIDYKEF